MSYTVKHFNVLPKEAKYIRTTVFQDEQGFKDEFDETDEVSVHFLAYDGDSAVGTLRLIPEDTGYHIGRVAVLKSYRGKGVGALLMRHAESLAWDMGAQKTVLSAQVRAKDFYRACGYQETGSEYLDENCPHILMIKEKEAK